MVRRTRESGRSPNSEPCRARSAGHLVRPACRPSRPALRPAARSLARSPMIHDVRRRIGSIFAAARIIPAFGFRDGCSGYRYGGSASAWCGQAKAASISAPCGFQHLQHPLLHGGEIFPAEQTTPNARLIGDDDHRHAGAVGGGDHRGRSRDQPDVLGAPQVPDLLDDHAVAVEEERGAERGSAGKAENFAPDALVVDAERTRRGRRLGHRATASPRGRARSVSGAEARPLTRHPLR